MKIYKFQIRIRNFASTRVLEGVLFVNYASFASVL